VSEEQCAGSMRDCTCGHQGIMHEWESRVKVGYVNVGQCAWSRALPPEGDDPRVQFELCACRKYNPPRLPMNPRESDERETGGK
jgi:hypothetical protein